MQISMWESEREIAERQAKEEISNIRNLSSEMQFFFGPMRKAEPGDYLIKRRRLLS